VFTPGSRRGMPTESHTIYSVLRGWVSRVPSHRITQHVSGLHTTACETTPPPEAQGALIGTHCDSGSTAPTHDYRDSTAISIYVIE
jgi:hypothetical protein